MATHGTLYICNKAGKPKIIIRIIQGHHVHVMNYYIGHPNFRRLNLNVDCVKSESFRVSQQCVSCTYMASSGRAFCPPKEVWG